MKDQLHSTTPPPLPCSPSLRRMYCYELDLQVERYIFRNFLKHKLTHQLVFKFSCQP